MGIHSQDSAEHAADMSGADNDTAPPSGPSDDTSGDSAPEDRQARRDARWRERATVAEARADRLARREVLRLLGERVADAEAALTLDETEVADLLNEDGDVDEAAVADLAGRVLTARPYLRRSAVHHADLGPRQSLPRRTTATWSGLLSGR
jgi:hypothetical protein